MHGQHLQALLVEDDDAYATMLQAELTAESSARVSVERARSLADATSRLAARPFDAVLLDAPCSGLGTIRRDPDLRWRRREEDLPALAVAQIDMLTRLATVVKPGGRLTYSTCSSEPEENEAVVEAFLAAHPAFRRGELHTGFLEQHLKALERVACPPPEGLAAAALALTRPSPASGDGTRRGNPAARARLKYPSAFS